MGILVASGYCQDSENKIVLQYWQYCAGCKATLEVLHGKAESKFKEMEEKKAGSSMTAKLDIYDLTNNICENKYFEGYKPFIRHACYKIIGDELSTIVKHYKRARVDDYRNTKGNHFSKAMDVCVTDIDACTVEEFKKSDIPDKSRTQCNACRIISDDMELIMNVVKYPTPSQIVEVICSTLGFSHQPYIWMEHYCEELVEDYSDKMVDAMTAQLAFIKKDRPPNGPLFQKICIDILGCDSSSFYGLRAVPVDDYATENVINEGGAHQEF